MTDNIDRCVYSPVYGFIDKILLTNHSNYYKIYIYITSQSDHRIFVPIDGALFPPTIKNGFIIEDPIHSHEKKQSFRQNINTQHTAEITWSIIHRNHSNADSRIYFTIQIGKPKFITDKIRIDKVAYDKIECKAKERLGEILLGSRAIIYLPTKYYRLTENTIKLEKNISIYDLENMRYQNKKDDLIGGETVLACLM